MVSCEGTGNLEEYTAWREKRDTTKPKGPSAWFRRRRAGHAEGGSSRFSTQSKIISQDRKSWLRVITKRLKPSFSVKILITAMDWLYCILTEAQEYGVDGHVIHIEKQHCYRIRKYHHGLGDESNMEYVTSKVVRDIRSAHNHKD